MSGWMDVGIGLGGQSDGRNGRWMEAGVDEWMGIG